MSISTRKGDGGETDLMFGRRVAKTHPRVVAGGAVDELNAALGLARAGCGEDCQIGSLVAAVQGDLVALMGELATLPKDLPKYSEKGYPRFGDEREGTLDAWVEQVEAEGLTFKGWAMPGAGGDLTAAHLDLARTVCRRAEREVLALCQDEFDPAVMRYLNRLSDALWLAARKREQEIGQSG